MQECLIDEKKKRWKDIGYVLVIYNNASVREYGVKTIVWIELLMGSHSVKYHCYLGSRSVRFFHWVLLSDEGSCSVISAQLGVPLSN